MPNMYTTCPRGHMYESRLSVCPYCFPNGANPNPPQNIGATSPVQNSNIGATNPLPNQNVGSTSPVNQNVTPPATSANSGKTVAIDVLQIQNGTQSQTPNTEDRVRPVVGWLVCVEGPDIGKDFRLHANYNSVGRAENQDVRINDKSVSREHFTVSYDLVNNRYFASMKNGQTFVYINGYPLGNGMTPLKKGDQIKVANTLLVFIPLEQRDVKWNWKI